MKRMYGMGALMVAMALSGICSIAAADVYVPREIKQATLAPIQSAEDAVASIPVLSRIPRSFLIGDGFKFKLSGTELRIDHMGTRSKAPVSRRHCMISIDFVSPVAFFGSSMELPLITSAAIGHGWNTTSLGDYVLHFSKESAVKTPTIGLKLTAQF